jgi:glycine cleavage system H lipoate-binding protein
MRCPFLKEARVKYCEKSAFRKMIRISGDVAEETCSSGRYKQCSVYQRYADDSDDKQCPYLRESLTQYCAAASVPRFIPYSESLLSRCGNDAYRYCDAYLGMAHPPAASGVEKGDYAVDGIRMPNWLYYSTNHFWLHKAKDGSCHLGIDGLLARVLGTVERITFLTQPGVRRPAAVLAARGVDLEVIFPNSLLLTACNLYLRANPARLTVDPYGMGWLFQGAELPGQAAVTSGLIRGDAILPWIRHEIDRMSDFLTECRSSQHGEPLANDGGVVNADVLRGLSRDETLRLFHEFFWGLRA